MKTILTVVESNRTVACFEKKNVSYFTTDLSKRLCDFFICIFDF